jgi:hypothetical protein
MCCMFNSQDRTGRNRRTSRPCFTCVRTLFSFMQFCGISPNPDLGLSNRMLHTFIYRLTGSRTLCGSM